MVKHISASFCSSHLLSLSWCASIAFALTGCDIVYGCLDDNRVRLSPTTLEHPVLNQEYNAVITASIGTEAQHSTELQETELLFEFRGDLPFGLTTTTNANKLTIEGTATELGQYDFNIKVDTNNTILSTSSSRSCSEINSQNYRFNVLPQ